MMKNILIIGCGLIGSSLLRSIVDKKIAKKIFIYEKSKSNILKIKKLKLPCEITSDLKKIIPNLNLIMVFEFFGLVCFFLLVQGNYNKPFFHCPVLAFLLLIK